MATKKETTSTKVPKAQGISQLPIDPDVPVWHPLAWAAIGQIQLNVGRAGKFATLAVIDGLVARADQEHSTIIEFLNTARAEVEAGGPGEGGDSPLEGPPQGNQ